MQRHDRSWREHGTLDALLATAFEKRPDVRELAERRFVDAGFPSGRQRRANLRDDQADLTGRDLHPRVLFHPVRRPETDCDAGHQEISLIPRFTIERHRPVIGAGSSPPLDHQADFVRSDAMDGARADQ